MNILYIKWNIFNEWLLLYLGVILELKVDQKQDYSLHCLYQMIQFYNVNTTY